jgi:hypothetical protein
MFERGQAREQREERQRMVELYATAHDASAALYVALGWLNHGPGWTRPSYLESGDQPATKGKSGQALWDAVDAFESRLARPN